MITEDYVSFETAKLLKEKGFDEATYHDYNDNGSRWFEEVLVCHNSQGGIACPTLQMAMKWLRDIHNLDIIAPPQFDNSKWTYSAVIFKLSVPCTEIRLNNNKDKKEEACEDAIKYCLEKLI